MGTNYYWHQNPPSPTCGHHDDGEGKHIGKSSGGWCFTLRVYPDEGINDLLDWQLIYALGEIRNDYGSLISPQEMTDTITKRSWKPSQSVPYGYLSWDAFYRSNHAVPGPDGLLRHAIGEKGNCIGHGSGTWDLVTGEFC